MARALAIVLCVVSCVACVSAPAPVSASGCRLGDAMVETQLFFGLSKPGGGTVTEREWQAFVAAEITPRFPEGFSVLDGAGFWRDQATKKTISEKSKVVLRLHGSVADADAATAAIIGIYKKRFQQDAVLRVDRPVCAQF